MRKFEIIDSEREGARPCGVLSADQGSQTFKVTLADWVGPNDVPMMFMTFAQDGKREVPATWVRAWIDERIAPPSRQNIGEIMRAHDLDEYDPLELLVSGEGRSSQDGFYIREIDAGYRDAARVGREFARARAAAGLSQSELAEKSGVRPETLSRIERGKVNPTAKTLEQLARAMGKRLSITLV